MHPVYASDLTPDQWDLLASLLPPQGRWSFQTSQLMPGVAGNPLYSGCWLCVAFIAQRLSSLLHRLLLLSLVAG
ncbi:MAG: hypothetical protein NW237_08695 [Cyanobacteriota bacterium]|nr:hypothetical protein [Cyanobacteriota bacterium]